ncbi:SMC-Scp complex subunit ScpB [Gorillibacterium sp. sgz500922]|uniref:SMC-Scp complex subunit ScpB n=1 Tax=Gorillibacterium sp. sgz500922 TaxID=3446694 RepID=UPI003F674213
MVPRLPVSPMLPIIEGLLFAAGDEGLDARQLAEVLEISAAAARELVESLRLNLKETGRGVQIVELAGSYQMTTVPEHAPYFEKLAESPSRSSLSQASLETLSIVAYRQPITRVEIEEIRGVKCDRALQTLVAKELIEETGRAEAVGRPILYGTTKPFLDYFGLSSLEDLPDSSLFGQTLDLEEEARLLFERPEAKQLTFEDVADSGETEAFDREFEALADSFLALDSSANSEAEED